MSKFYPLLSEKIATMSEGDEDFKSQLTVAIHKGILELKESYKEGRKTENELIIQQIRHKVKPTLMIFGFDDLIEFLHEGKIILESEGFGLTFNAHAALMEERLDLALFELSALK